MISLYNIAISLRQVQIQNIEQNKFGGLQASLQMFEQSLGLSEDIQDLEHKAMCKGQIGVL